MARFWAVHLSMWGNGYLRSKRAYGIILFMGAILLLAACSPTDYTTDRRDPEIALKTDGEAIYNASCASCHGLNGEGEPNWKTPKEDGTYPAPPHTVDGHTWHHGDGTLFAIIKGGGDSLNIPNFTSNMPAFAEILNDEEIVAVLDYIKILWPEEQRQLQSEMSQQYPLPGS